MFKSNKRKPTDRIDFSKRAMHEDNNIHEAEFNPVKKYFGTVSTDKQSYIVIYECKFRSEAIAIFEEESRLAGGKLDKYIGVLK